MADKYIAQLDLLVGVKAEDFIAVDRATVGEEGTFKISIPTLLTDTAKIDVAQTFTASQRGTVTVNNDGAFNLDVTNKFSCTPIGNITLTFTNLVSGQGGIVLLDNSGGHIITKATSVLCDADLLTTVTTAGKYAIGYECDGTNVWVTSSRAVS